MRYGVVYALDRDSWRLMARFFIAETEFSRDMSSIEKGPKSARTIAFPSTVRAVRDGAFYENDLLRSAVLNEGLETLGGCCDIKEKSHRGVFYYT